MEIFSYLDRFWGILLLHGEYVRRGALATGEASVPDASGASGFVVVDKGHDIASVTSGVYNVAAPPHNGGHALPPRPGSAASSHLSGIKRSQKCTLRHYIHTKKSRHIYMHMLFATSPPGSSIE